VGMFVTNRFLSRGRGTDSLHEWFRSTFVSDLDSLFSTTERSSRDLCIPLS
jgi:hypothetical protein